ncbi:MAG: hypothetical protein ABS69_10665 [Nitrosomonadales bacterium SCN 54-20]|nr:MAG: hypothetical protein ABS69_10665 [Nitrosomonadales bacterium SCN 54-20]
MLRCKKGDLAMVLRGLTAGSMVEILEFRGKATSFRTKVVHDNVWLVSCRGETRGADGRRLGKPDEWLPPIRPGDLKETDETEREVESV